MGKMRMNSLVSTFTLFSKESSAYLLKKMEITNLYRNLYLALNVQV